MQGEFKKQGYAVVKNAVDRSMLKLLSTELLMIKDIDYFYKNKSDSSYQGDHLVEKSFSWYSPLCLESLMVILLPTLESIVEKSLFPTFSYVRFYYNQAILPNHIDGPRSEYAASVCIDSDTRWPLIIQNNIDQVHVDLEPGDLCIYKGIDYSHWREPFTGTRQIQAFLSYVDANGQFKHHQRDQRPLLGLPYDVIIRNRR